MPAWKEAVWFSLLTDTALKSAAVWGVAWIAAKLLGGRSAAWRHSVWMAAAAAVLAIPFLAAGLPVLRVPVAMPELTFRTNATIAVAPQSAVASPSSRVAESPARKGSWYPDWQLVLMLIWAAGAALGMAQMLWGGAAMARARRRARPYPQQDIVVGLVDEPVPVLELPAGTMPMTFGVLQPVVFMPADAAEWPEERCRLVLLHELAHVKRGDAATHLLARLALCFYWWNPLAWMAWREFLKERERAADDLVLAAGARASDYAGHLLEVARSLQPVPSVAWAAVAMARPSQLEGRLVSILSSKVNRNALGRFSAAAVAFAAVIVVAPFAAMHAQDQRGAPVPGDVRFRASTPVATAGTDQGAAAIPGDLDATIRAALAQKNHDMLEQAASGYERLKDYGTAQKLLEAALGIREQASGAGSVEYGIGLMNLGNLALRQKQAGEAASLYTRALAVLTGKPEAAQPLFDLGLIRYTQKNYAEALGYFQQMQAADPAHSGRSLLWMALAHQAAGETAEAESMFRRAMAETGSTPQQAAAVSLFKQFLENQGRQDEAATLPTIARTEAHVSPGAGAYRVGNGGVAAPKLLSKQEPEYSEEARAAKYQGTTVLYVEIGPDGLAHNAQVVRALGMGLDQKAMDAIGNWRFSPGTKDGVPVNVAATIEVNFRLM